MASDPHRTDTLSVTRSFFAYSSLPERTPTPPERTRKALKAPGGETLLDTPDWRVPRRHMQHLLDATGVIGGFRLGKKREDLEKA